MGWAFSPPSLASAICLLSVSHSTIIFVHGQNGEKQKKTLFTHDQNEIQIKSICTICLYTTFHCVCDWLLHICCTISSLCHVHSLYSPNISRAKRFSAEVLSLSPILVFKPLHINIGFRGIVFPNRYNYCNFIAQARWKQTSLHYNKDQVVIFLLWKLGTFFYRIIELVKITTTGTHQCTNFAGNL